MNRLISAIKLNRVAVVLGLVGLAVWSLGFQYMVGFNAPAAGILYLLILAVALGVYRLLNRSAISLEYRLGYRRLILSGVIGLIVVGLAIQAVPFGRDYSNPPVTAEPAWDSPRTRELAVRACFDCHSNEVSYPWYSKIAPVSWAVERHVSAGRNKVNYSEWDKPQKDADESAETVEDGSMPPAYFTLLTHSEARLTAAEKQQLIDGFNATFGSEGSSERD